MPRAGNHTPSALAGISPPAVTDLLDDWPDPLEFLLPDHAGRLARKYNMDPREVTRLINEGLDALQVDVRSDDGSHFAALVVSSEFEGLRPLQRHQLVYKALGERVGREIHALSIRALTPAEAGEQSD